MTRSYKYSSLRLESLHCSESLALTEWRTLARLLGGKTATGLPFSCDGPEKVGTTIMRSLYALSA